MMLMVACEPFWGCHFHTQSWYHHMLPTCSPVFFEYAVFCCSCLSLFETSWRAKALNISSLYCFQFSTCQKEVANCHIRFIFMIDSASKLVFLMVVSYSELISRKHLFIIHPTPEAGIVERIHRTVRRHDVKTQTSSSKSEWSKSVTAWASGGRHSDNNDE